MLNVNIAPEVLAWALSRSLKSPEEPGRVRVGVTRTDPLDEWIEVSHPGAARDPGLGDADAHRLSLLEAAPPEEPPLWPLVRADEGRKPRLLNALTRHLLRRQRGFCFEDKRKRLLLDSRSHYVDPLSYRPVLKFHVLVMRTMRTFRPGPLKRLEAERYRLIHSYVLWHADNQMSEGDNPPAGVLLCTEKDHTVVKYAVSWKSNELFVSKYQVAVATEAELKDVSAGVMR